MRMSRKALLDFATNVEGVFENREPDGKWAFVNFIPWKERVQRYVDSIDRTNPDSYDSTEIWWFRDGTAIVVDNPAQAAFCASVSLVY